MHEWKQLCWMALSLLLFTLLNTKTFQPIDNRPWMYRPYLYSWQKKMSGSLELNRTRDADLFN